VDTGCYTPADRVEDYFLVVSRLVPYKRVDLAVAAFSELGLPLVVIGDGPEREKLQRMAAPNVRLMGRLSDEETGEYYSRCRAFVFPGEEDFGITPLEAQAAGRPVIAYGAGGARDTVKQGATGEFFYPQTAAALAEAVRGFDPDKYDPRQIREHALKFDTGVFKDRIRDFVYSSYEEFHRNGR